MTEARTVLLSVALHHVVNEPNIESGYQRIAAIAGSAIDYNDFCDAVADCIREGLIHEPIRLPEGALQCHWHLELTPKGVSIARELPRDHSA